MSGIRVTYSGLISFTVGIISIITGFVFILIVTRQLTQEEFGTWGLIGGLVSYVIITEPIISFWITRETARSLESGKTAIISTGFFSIAGIVAYIIIAYFVAQGSDASQNVLFFASILIPTIFLQRTLTAINLGWKPQATSYGALAFESIKIPAGIILVYFFDMGIIGAILTTAIAHIASIVILMVYAKDKIKNKLNIAFLKKWLKLFWLPLYGGIQNIIVNLDVVIFTIITGSVIGLAFYSAAMTIASLVRNSGSFSEALYSKFLEGGKKEYLQENLTRFFYLAIPLVALSIVFAKPALFALNPKYAGADIIVIIMTIRAVFNVILGVFEASLAGIEKVDVNEESRWKNYIRSKLFFLPTVHLIQNSLYVGTLAVVLFLLKSYNISQLDLVTYWSIIALVIQIPFTLYFYKLVKENFTLNVPLISILKYVLIGIGVFGTDYVVTQQFLEYKISIFEFLPNLVLFVGSGICCYLLITYLLDSETRKLFNSIMAEMKKNNQTRL